MLLYETSEMEAVVAIALSKRDETKAFMIEC